MDEIVFCATQSPDGGFTAYALGYSIFIEADDLDELERSAQEAVRCHFDDYHSRRIAFTEKMA